MTRVGGEIKQEQMAVLEAPGSIAAIATDDREAGGGGERGMREETVELQTDGVRGEEASRSGHACEGVARC